MKVKIKLEFKNGMIVETPNWKEVRSRGHLEEMIHWMIVENGVEMGKPNVFITTDPAEKKKLKKSRMDTYRNRQNKRRELCNTVTIKESKKNR